MIHKINLCNTFVLTTCKSMNKVEAPQKFDLSQQSNVKSSHNSQPKKNVPVGFAPKKGGKRQQK